MHDGSFHRRDITRYHNRVEAAVTISLWLFGVEVLNLTIGPTPTDDETEYDGSGYTASQPISFVSHHDLPDDANIHRPVSPFEDDSEA